jgi:hypothetical protein
MKITSLLALLLLCGTVPVCVPAQQPPVAVVTDKILDGIMPDAEALRNVTMETAFITVLRLAKLPGGIIEVNDCTNSVSGSKGRQSYLFTGFKIREALDRIVSENPDYKWEVKDGAVNLVSLKGVPPVLNVSLLHFEVDPQDSAGGAASRLFGRPEVRKIISELKLTKEDKLQVLIGGAPRRLVKAISFNSATVVNILNSVARNNPYPAVWHYVETTGNCNHTYYLDWPVR